jgi:hypothetical protein
LGVVFVVVDGADDFALVAYVGLFGGEAAEVVGVGPIKLVDAPLVDNVDVFGAGAGGGGGEGVAQHVGDDGLGFVGGDYLEVEVEGFAQGFEFAGDDGEVVVAC